jgi:hypothetical protein
LAIGRSSSDTDGRLYVVRGGKADPKPLGSAHFTLRRAVLHVSPDGRVAAAVKSDYRLGLIALADGSELPVSEELSMMTPRGWSAEGHLWLSQGGYSAPARMRLLRVDPRTGSVVEERNISPSELDAASYFNQLLISRNGEHTVFLANRRPGTLSIVRGLWSPRN